MYQTRFELFALAIVTAVLTLACSRENSSAEPVRADAARTELNSGVHLDSMDTATRPVDDFYQYVNGAWLDNTPIPPIYSGYTVYHQVFEEAELALREIIESAAANRGEEGSESQKVGDVYRSWMDEETINSLGADAIRPELDIVRSIDSTRALVSAIAELKARGIMMPITWDAIPDLKDTDRYAAYLWQDGLTMPNRDYYLELENENFSRARDGLQPYIASMLKKAGWTEAQAQSDAARIYALESEIAVVHWDAVDNRDPEKIYNPYAVEDLKDLGSNFDWTTFRESLGVESQPQLIIEQPSYFEGLDRLVASVPLEDWKSYLAFRVMDSRGHHLDQETADIRFAYRNRVLFGQEQEQPRWKRGVRMVNAMVGEAVGKLYVAEHFPPEAKARVVELVSNVIATLDDDLAELEWMSEETRQKARIKLSKFTAKVGYPDEWKDYSTLDIEDGDHMGNVRRAAAWEHQRLLDKLGGPVDRNEWQMTPQTVNAYYDSTKNEIVFPAARLQPPFFQLDADDAINYGAVGGVIGHEISHGFDDSGSKFDGDGKLESWWTEEDRARFEELTSVLVEQYNAYEPVEGMHINGELTLGENIGDLSGVAMAYRAYIRSLDGQEPPVIDGFTGPQRFFIGYAMSRKGKYREEALVNYLASDPHSPLKYRVNGVYRNIDAFHEAFGTQPGDGMWLDPEERVKIW